jgi:hypothetical protein
MMADGLKSTLKTVLKYCRGANPLNNAKDDQIHHDIYETLLDKKEP